MAEVAGRLFTIKDSDAVLIAEGISSKGFEATNEGIDITSDDSAGWITFMSTPGQKSVSMSVDGVFTNSTLKTKAMSGTDIMLSDVAVYDGAGTLTGGFIITNYSNAAEKDGAVMFSATLQSSGPMVAS